MSTISTIYVTQPTETSSELPLLAVHSIFGWFLDFHLQKGEQHQLMSQTPIKNQQTDL